jgi:hypothetical protein
MHPFILVREWLYLVRKIEQILPGYVVLAICGLELS